MRPAALPWAAPPPDGSLLLAGAVGQFSPQVEHDPSAPRDFTWVVARVTPAGTLDRSFGDNGLARVAGGDSHGHSLSRFPDGSIATTGSNGHDQQLARLTPAGAMDPAFHGGTPVTLSGAQFASQLLARADGTTDVLAAGQAGTSVVRYSRSGDPAAPVAIDAGPLPSLPSLTAMPDGTEVVTGPESVQPQSGPAAVRVTRLKPD